MNYLIPAILALVVGYILWLLKRERVSLRYDLTESDSFPRENGNGKYFVIKLKNTGNKAIENISITVNFDSEVIETTSYSQEALLSDLLSDNRKISCSIPLLNPKEDISITITAQSQSIIGTPKFVARATGVTAVSADNGSEFQSLTQTLTLAVTTALVVYAGYTALNIYKRPIPEAFEKIESITERLGQLNVDINTKESLIKELEKLKKIESSQRSAREKGEPDTQQIVFSIFNKAEISHLYFEFVTGDSDISYWRTGVFLMHRFIQDSTDRDKYIAAMELLVNQERVAASSIGFNLYLLAKMQEHLGNTEKSLESLKRCKDTAPLMYEHLMAQDPAFNTKVIENYFKNNG
jgi:hypothetical protein